MSKAASFWDSSAMVPLCVQAVTSREAQSQLRKSMPVLWWGKSSRDTQPRFHACIAWEN